MAGLELAMSDRQASVIVIWTTTPWTIPGNRAIAFSRKIAYGLYRVIERRTTTGRRSAQTYRAREQLAERGFRSAQVERFRTGRGRFRAKQLHRARFARIRSLALGYDVRRPPSRRRSRHGRRRHGLRPYRAGPRPRGLRIVDGERPAELAARQSTRAFPAPVDENGAFTDEAPGFTGKRVLTDKGEQGDANKAVIDALVAAGALIARGKLKHQYPHSWRSKKPIIFRNTPQWFIAMDKPIAGREREPARDGACAPSARRAGRRRRARTASAAWCRPSPTG